MPTIRAGIIIQKDDKFLLVQEKMPRNYGLWNWAQGKVEDGETPEEAAIREAKEETGFDVEIVRKITVLENPFPDTKEIHVYLGSVVGGEIGYSEDEILDVQWFTFEEIEAMKDKLVGYRVINVFRVL